MEYVIKLLKLKEILKILSSLALERYLMARLTVWLGILLEKCW